jgi:hypothetical protein
MMLKVVFFIALIFVFAKLYYEANRELAAA